MLEQEHLKSLRKSVISELIKTNVNSVKLINYHFRLNFPEKVIAEVKNAKDLIVIETSYLPHLYELQLFMNSKPFFTTSSFKLYNDQGKLLCLCYTGDRVDYSQFLNTLLPSLKALTCTVTTIALNPLNSFKTEASIDTSVLRCLSTTKIQGVLPLETPNFISSGVSASIATYGKFYEFPCTTFVLFTNDLDQDSLQKLTTVLDKLSFSLNLKPKSVSNGNSLYI